ncbi:thiamine ABC transporter substrate binding subunit [uncultured Aliiroseovarius sp.]|uniref:thiamine ABC transporter substrate binding subunit n=1 Tax=uncultured Aliiroseovarius sp. TaxID=1658783 RepID=UPI0026082B0F|nr:thiamine ABC transporter substrate binding subunit [uncultured Aliiroseovarius sp.]
MKAISFVAGAALATVASTASADTLTVYTYDSFTSDWGPGPAVEKAFEAECDCDLEFVAMGDGAELLARLKLEGARTDADIVLGLDTNLTAAAKDTGLFAPHSVTADWSLPIEWTDTTFIPYDWGYFAFVYDKEKVSNPPESFDALAASDLSILIQDPRSSTPGLGLLLWVKSVYGDKAAEAWAGLNDQVVTVTKGWSEAYGMFLEGEADLVLSYTTSPAYHLIAEDDDSKAAIAFEEGNYMQIEVAGKVASSDQPELADKFMAFVASEAFQSIIPTTNWMYPAVTPKAGLPAGFETLAQPGKALVFSSEEAGALRKPAVEEWLATSAK